MTSAKHLLSSLVEAEEYSDFEAIQLVKAMFDVSDDDFGADRYWNMFEAIWSMVNYNQVDRYSFGGALEWLMSIDERLFNRVMSADDYQKRIYGGIADACRRLIEA